MGDDRLSRPQTVSRETDNRFGLLNLAVHIRSANQRPSIS